jgi:predicted permease
MRPFRALLIRVLGLFSRDHSEHEFANELQSHLEMHIADNLRAGMTPQEARRQALLQLGGLEPTKQLYRERRGLPFLETLLQDLRYAARSLRKNPGFTIIAVLTLALGIGANTAIFSMVNALLLHPYNFRDLDRLVNVWEDRGIDKGIDTRFIAAPDASELQANTRVFDGFATFRCGDFNLNTNGSVQPVRGCAVSPNFFQVLSVVPALGRAFMDDEAQPGADGVLVLSYGFWQRRFAADPEALGKSIQMNGRKYVIVGIMPRGFDYPVPMELWTPLALTPDERADRSQLSLNALARMAPGVSVGQARSVADSLARQLQQQYPVSNTNRRIVLLQLRRELYAYTLPLFGLLQAAAAFVLLLACANLSNVLFARMFGRQREIAVRTALGAGRFRLARLFITETLLLSCCGATLATAASFWTVKLLRTGISPSWTKWVPGWDGIQVDRSVLAFTVGLAVLVGALFGLSVVFYSRRAEPYTTLKEAGRSSDSVSKGRLSGALVVAQVMFALVLLVCAGLTTQAFMRLANVYQGFQPANVLHLGIALPEKSYPDNARIRSFYERLLTQSAALPGAQVAAVVTNSPASNADNESTFFTINGRPALQASETPSADLQIASSGTFATLRIPLVAGRFYSDADNASAARVVVISRSMADQFWPKSDALGRQIKLGPADSSEPWATIIGVVEDVRQNWWNPTKRPTIYQPFFQAPQRSMIFLLRAASHPTSYLSSVREIVQGIDDQIALTEVDTLQDEITDSIAIIRILGVLMTLFGCVALVLSSIGVYGVLAESVARRTPEIGIRLALGANPRDIRKLVLGQAAKLTATGLALGVPLAFLINRLMTSLIFGIVSINVVLLLAFTALLVTVALAAAYIPARRAMGVDPIVALRYE